MDIQTFQSVSNIYMQTFIKEVDVLWILLVTFYVEVCIENIIENRYVTLTDFNMTAYGKEEKPYRITCREAT